MKIILTLDNFCAKTLKQKFSSHIQSTKIKDKFHTQFEIFADEELFAQLSAEFGLDKHPKLFSIERQDAMQLSLM